MTKTIKPYRSFSSFTSLCLNEGFVELLSEVYLTVESCHLLLIVKYFLFIDLIHVAVVVVKPSYFCLSSFQGYSLAYQVILQFLILLDYSCGIELVFSLYLINFNVLKSLKLDLLLIKSRYSFSFGAVSI